MIEIFELSVEEREIIVKHRLEEERKEKLEFYENELKEILKMISSLGGKIEVSNCGPYKSCKHCSTYLNASKVKVCP